MHQNFRRNKKVFVIFKDGNYLVDKWHCNDGKEFRLVYTGWHRFDRVKSISIYKNKRLERK